MPKSQKIPNIFLITCVFLLVSGILIVINNPQIINKLIKPADSSAQTELIVSAASSLQDALEEIQLSYRQKHPEVKLTYNFASSGALQQQIEQGAPADIFISAAAKQMDALEAKGLLLDETRKVLLKNKVVLIAPQNSTEVTGFNSLADSSIVNVAIGEPTAVPAGKYAQEILQSLKLWDQVKPKLVYAKNVRQVLTYVETENAAAGLVYLSDTKTSSKVKIIAEAPPGTHKPVIYPLAVLKSTQLQPAARQFVSFLESQQAAEVFQKYGFLTSEHKGDSR